MKRVAVAGASGFLGGALCSALDGDFSVSPIGRKAFGDTRELASCLLGQEAVIFAAGVSRGDDLQRLYQENVALVEALIAAMESIGWLGCVYFISTTHECKDTPYHASKRASRGLLDAWARRSGGAHIGLLVPNTFGPGGKIFYNSAVCTFAWQVAHGETPTILQDGAMELLYVDRFIRQMREVLSADPAELANPYTLRADFQVKVSETIRRLQALSCGGKPMDELDRALSATLEAAAKITN